MADGTFASLPDPGTASSLDDLVERLRQLKVWAGDPSYETITGRVNAAWTEAGRPPGELARKTQALAVFRETGGRDGETYALNGLGEAASPCDALAHHTAALAIADEIGALDQQARAHAGLFNAHRALGDAVRAREHHERALVLYTDLGMPQADEIRRHLT